MKLLLVEDEATLRQTVVETLRQSDYVVELAISFAQACEYDCVLVDLTLPDGDGLDLGADDYLVKPFPPAISAGQPRPTRSILCARTSKTCARSYGSAGPTTTFARSMAWGISSVWSSHRPA